MKKMSVKRGYYKDGNSTPLRELNRRKEDRGSVERQRAESGVLRDRRQRVGRDRKRERRRGS